MNQKKRIVLKLTGEVLQHSASGLDASLLESVAQQVKTLLPTVQFGIVMGGGNFFRGAQRSEIHIAQNTAHTVGMLATMMNGLIIQDIFEGIGITTALFSAIPCESAGYELSPQNIRNALNEKDCLIFAGGTGNPYFTTDTTSVLRTLQLNASELWKGTKVDGIYAQDPLKDPSAAVLKKVTYKDAIKNRLGIMDMSAFVLAEEHKIRIRIFNVFTDNALIHAASNKEFGSLLSET